MKKSLLLTGITLSLLTACQQQTSLQPFAEQAALELTPEEETMIASCNAFAFTFLQKTCEWKKQEKNIFLSPLSALFNAGMLANGAAGNTAREWEAVLPASNSNLQSANTFFLKLLNQLPRRDSTTTFHAANSIWIDQKAPVKTSFQEINRRYYQAEVQNLKFSDPKSARRINQWTQKQTQGHITRVLDKAQGDCILINTLFFQGAWTDPFDPAQTRQEDFYPTEGESHQVRMMHRPDVWLRYRETAQFEMATLPYGNHSYALTVILPKRSVSMDSCIQTLAEAKERNWWSAADTIYRNLDLKLPSFQLDYQTSLIPIYQEMGIHDAFQPNLADFSQLTELPSYISSILQFTYLDVTENHTVAAAATVTRVNFESETISQTAPHPFHVNRPFLIAIHENPTGLILFLGKVTAL